MKKIKAIVSGKVQGVFFRKYTQAEAKKLGVRGYVRNLRSGDVEILAQGKTEKVDALMTWAETGPPSAIVKNLQIEITNDFDEKFDDFEIRY